MRLILSERHGDSCGGGGDGEAEPCLRERGPSPDARDLPSQLQAETLSTMQAMLKSFQDQSRVVSRGHQSFARGAIEGAGPAATDGAGLLQEAYVGGSDQRHGEHGCGEGSGSGRRSRPRRAKVAESGEPERALPRAGLTWPTWMTTTPMTASWGMSFKWLWIPTGTGKTSGCCSVLNQKL